MNRDPDLTQDTDDDDDAWASLAEDLFGSDPDALPPLVMHPAAGEEENSPSPNVSESAKGEEDESLSPVAATEPEPPDELTEASSGVSSMDEEDLDESDDAFDDDFTLKVAETDQPVAAAKDDPFWNALSEWDWEEGQTPAPAEDVKKQAEKGRTRRKPKTEAAPAKQADVPPVKPTVQKSKPTPVEKPPLSEPGSAGFGGGLFDGDVKQDESSEGSSTAVVDSGDKQEATESEAKPRPRRRRRRRRLAGEESPAPSTEKVETEEPEPVDEVATTEAVVEEAAEAKDETVAEAAPEKSRRRRKRGRRRSKSSDAAAAPKAEEKSLAIEDESPPPEDVSLEQTNYADADDDDDDGESSSGQKDLERKKQEVPTWEEAISYILNPSQVESATSAPARRQKSTAKSSSSAGESDRKSSAKKPGSSRRRRSS